MIVEKNKTISVSYTLKFDNAEGELIETVPNEEPLEFKFGSGELLESFEAELAGKKVGDAFSFSLSPEQAYGEVLEHAVASFEKSEFEVDGKIDDEILQPGEIIPMKDDDDVEFEGVILEVSDDTVTIDFNHPLAGETIHFDGEVVEIV